MSLYKDNLIKFILTLNAKSKKGRHGLFKQLDDTLRTNSQSEGFANPFFAVLVSASKRIQKVADNRPGIGEDSMLPVDPSDGTVSIEYAVDNGIFFQRMLP